MVKERIDDLVDILGEEFANLENTFVISNNKQLAKYIENPEKWKAQQLKNRLGYKKALINEARSQIEQLNEKTEKVYLLSYKEVDKETIKVSETEIDASKLPDDAKKSILAMKKFNAEQVVKLANQSFKEYTKEVKIISSYKTPDEFYDVIKNQFKQGIQNGMKVAYKDGRVMNWKSYMEMNVRTTLSQEMTERQMKVGGRVGQVFYIVDSFSDCADDHADYQGKIYYNEEADIPKEAQDYIDQNGILSMQEVANNVPFLTTRPNCRHNFHAIPLSEVLTTPTDKILEDNGFKYGEYEAKNYEALQEQRYNERQIRKWKMTAENNRLVADQTNQADLLTIKNADDKVKYWQSRQRQLIKENKGVLERDYERESAKTMIYNLGVKYDIAKNK